MKYENKIVNQPVRFRFNSGNPLPTCSRCNSLMERPTSQSIFTIDSRGKKHTLVCYHYINRPYFLVPSKSGYASVYCSGYCMMKHNAKFTRKQ